MFVCMCKSKREREREEKIEKREKQVNKETARESVQYDCVLM